MLLIADSPGPCASALVRKQLQVVWLHSGIRGEYTKYFSYVISSSTCGHAEAPVGEVI